MKILFAQAESGLRSCLLVLLAAMFGAALYAQEYRGRIQGMVVDASQAAVVGATITLLNTDTNVSTIRQTSQTGRYLFDLVVPGNYSLTVQTPGFTTFRAEAIVLRQRGDVTVDAALKLSDVRETVDVSAQTAQVQFNTSRFETTVDSQMTLSLPQFFRNPYFLSKTDPSVADNDTARERLPFYGNASRSQNVGGSSTPDVQVDGASVGVAHRAGYAPTPDMVQEVNVQLNAVDPEFGYGRGAAISISLKSGTNEVHGVAFYQGVYPWANAILNRVSRTVNVQRNHIFGGTLGHPIKRNKWFNFVAFEGWKLVDPATLIGQLPTALERQGDFSQSLNSKNALRVIYDPWTTYTSPDGATIRRTPFAGNQVPLPMISRVAAAYTAALPPANLPGVGNYQAQNYAAPIRVFSPYKNFSDRTDYNINDSLRYSGRLSLFRTPITADNPTGNDLGWMSDRGSQRNATQIANGITWTKSPTTVISGTFTYYGLVDMSVLRPDPATFKGYHSLWPNSSWYRPIFEGYKFVEASPGMQITHADGGRIMSSYSWGIGASGGYWVSQPWQDITAIKISQQRGKHYVKAGFDSRGTRSYQVANLTLPNFTFNAVATANTYVSPDTKLSGDGYASFLLGAIDSAQMPIQLRTNVIDRGFATYLGDDWKIGRRLTLNLGLRYEYERPFREEKNRIDRGPDMTVPIPELQGVNAPQMPAVVKQFFSGRWIFNGAFRWTEESHRGQWNAGPGTLSPRVGFAFRVNDKTGVRVGWGRYITPWTIGSTLVRNTSYGFNYSITAPSPVLGVPQMHLDNPFPPSYPIPPLVGKSFGPYTGLGDSLPWMADDRPRQYTNRLNFSVQREISMGMVADVTYYLSFSNAPASRNINQVDPMIAYTYKAATNLSVVNPFYQLLPEAKFPGPLRNKEKVALSALTVPYPQYGSLTVSEYEDNGGSHFQQFSIRLRKSYGNGLAFVSGYSNTYQKDLSYYNDVATYLQQRTWEAATTPRHRVTFAGAWELPLGKGRAFLNAAPRAIDALIGGWSASPLLTWRSGNLLKFGGLLVSGDPHVSNPGPKGWFDPTVFAVLPAYTQRTNPVMYPGITGPGYLNLDLSLVKAFRVTERFSAELRVDAFNAPNSMTWNDPSTSVTSTFFGKSGDALLANGMGIGRQTQLGLRIRF